MAFISDSFLLSYSSPITITGTEENSTSLELQEAGDLPLELSGFVYSTTLGGSIVENAFVSVFDASEVLVTSAYTDSAGHYSITTLTAGDYLLTASKSGFTPSTLLPVTLAADPVVQDIVIQPYSSTDRVVYGVVSDTQDDPIDGARVNVIDSLGAVVASTVSIDDGEYAVYGLPSGTYTLVFTATGFAANSVEAEVTDLVPLVNKDITLTAFTPPAEQATISGFITDPSSDPLTGAWVGLYSVSAGVETLIDSTMTTSDGYYIFTGVVPGDYVIKSKAVA